MAKRSILKMAGRFLAGMALVVLLPFLCVLYARFVEPEWIAVRSVKLGDAGQRTCRAIHITDIHYKGDKAYLERVVERCNDIDADFVCFTGDLVEDGEFLVEALSVLEGMKHPMYGVPGNHDYWSFADQFKIARCLESTGGAWLEDADTTAADGRVHVVGFGKRMVPQPRPDTARKEILLTHYPQSVHKLGARKFDLILAGHSHGGQVRLPFGGSLLDLSGVGEYDRGLFMTEWGPLYVNPGIGAFYWPVRFCCRPEITVIEF